MLHGAGSNSLIYGDWLIPPLVANKQRCAVAVDFPCDTGRSSPRDGNPKNCPSTEAELAEWVEQIVQGLSLMKPVDIVGYSYGTLVAFETAVHRPHLVRKLVLLAPGIFTPISFKFLWRAIFYSIVPTNRTQNWLLRGMTTNASFDLQASPELSLRHLIAIRKLQATVLAVPFPVVNDTLLEHVFRHIPTMVGVGMQEVIGNATTIVARAKQAGAQRVVGYPNASHLMIIELPTRDIITQDVASFLLDETIEVDDAEKKKAAPAVY